MRHATPKSLPQTGRGSYRGRLLAGAGALLAAAILPASSAYRSEFRPTEKRSRAEEIASSQVVPLVDVPRGQRIYTPAMLRLALLGALLGALALGAIAYLVATGIWPIRGFGQFASSGVDVAAFTGTGVGAALGALGGGLVALLRVPRAMLPTGSMDHDHDS